MRVSLLAGAILTAIGVFVIVKGVSYSKEESVFKLGGIEAKVQQERRIPQWTGGIALGAGLVLVVTGLMKR
jgi:hypothetical protein